jgi:hypothetical protein
MTTLQVQVASLLHKVVEDYNAQGTNTIVDFCEVMLPSIGCPPPPPEGDVLASTIHPSTWNSAILSPRPYPMLSQLMYINFPPQEVCWRYILTWYEHEHMFVPWDLVRKWKGGDSLGSTSLMSSASKAQTISFTRSSTVARAHASCHRALCKHETILLHPNREVERGENGC